MTDKDIYFHINNGGLKYSISLAKNEYGYLCTDGDKAKQSEIIELNIGTIHFGIPTNYTIPILDKKTANQIIDALNEAKEHLIDEFKE